VKKSVTGTFQASELVKIPPSELDDETLADAIKINEMNGIVNQELIDEAKRRKQN
jgi:hypothetical protein